jgi:hypothetical protein
VSASLSLFETKVSSIMAAEGLTGLDGRGKAAQRIHAQQLADWESSGKRALWERWRAEEQPTVEEKIALSRRVLVSEASPVIWNFFKNGEWCETGSLAPNVLQVSFSFVDRDGHPVDGSGKVYIIRKAKRILEEQKQSGRWLEIRMTPVAAENKFLHDFNTLRAADPGDSVFETLSNPLQRREDIAAALIEKAQIHPCRYTIERELIEAREIVPHVVTPKEKIHYLKMACKLLWIMRRSEEGREKRAKMGGWVPTRSCVDLHTSGTSPTPDEEIMPLDEFRAKYAATEAKGKKTGGRPQFTAQQRKESEVNRRDYQRRLMKTRRSENCDSLLADNPTLSS